MGHLRNAVRPSRSVEIGRRRRDARLVDREGELLSVPVPLSYVWLVLVVFTVLEAVNNLFGVAGPHWFYDNWVYNVILGVCAALVLGRAAFEPIARRAWLAFGIALALWFLGSTAWTAVYAGQPNAPYPTFADVFWLAWYPLVAAGIFFLVRIRVPRFELHRWMDGIAVTLLVLAAGFAMVIQPVANHKTVGTLAAFVAFLYPILDVLLVGALLGVYGLLGWRPDGMWILIGFAIVSTSIADAIFAVQEAEARSVVSGTSYDFVWTAGAILIAFAAWVRAPEDNANPEGVTGMRAIALALFAQALAIGIQIYAIFKEVGKDERIVTIVVLLVASVQIILTRPRRRQDDVPQPSEAAKAGQPETDADVVT
jgi:diguanylate cyclase